MLLLFLAVAVCISTTVLLLLGADSRWFYGAAFTNFAVYLVGDLRSDVAFTEESQTFMLLCFAFFLGLIIHLAPDTTDIKDESSAQRTLPWSRKEHVPIVFLFSSFYLLIFSHSILKVHWSSLDAGAQASVIVSAYMGVVGFFLLRQARLEEERLEPPHLED